MEIEKTENLVFKSIVNIISNEENHLSKNGFKVKAELIKNRDDKVYESEIDITLIRGQSVLDIYVIDIIFKDERNESIFTDERSLKDRENEVVKQLREWERNYINSRS